VTAATTTPQHALTARGALARGRLGRLLRGRPADPRWVRPALAGLLALTALLYLFELSRNGWANDFYAAAVQAGTKSWKAFFFGSFDSSNFITVDKTPASLWVMELSARVFGVNYWSLLVPQALEGVASVALLYLAVRRWSGPAAGLLAGLVMALTPAAVLIFRFNNPDALLVLAMTAAAYAMVRAIEAGRTRWLVTAGLLLGFAFLAKMLQAFLVVPGFALAYLWAGPVRLRRRIWQVLVAGAGIVAGAGWWVLIAQLTPAASRPYFGGSASNSILQLTIGYNGLGRLTGNETGSIGGRGGPGGSRFGGPTGITRLLSAQFGGQVSWLLPAALLSMLALLWVTRRAVRTDRTRAAVLLWGGWLLCTGLVFSYMSGIIHPYYMVALAPAIGALVGIGAMAAWRARHGWPGRTAAAAALLISAVWAFQLLARTPSWQPWLRPVVLLAGLAGAAAILAGPHLTALASTASGRLALAGVPVALALLAGLAGPAAYAIDTVSTAHTGALPSAGPQTAAFGGPGGPGGPEAFGGGGFGPGGGAARGGAAGGRSGSAAGGGFGGAAGATGTGQVAAGTGQGAAGANRGPGAGSGTRPAGFGGRGGFAGGLSGNTQVSSALTRLLKNGAAGYRWVAATEGSQEAAPLELATGEAVMAIGGFNGTDPAPTLAEFQAMVAKHEIHYYVGRGSQSFGGGRGSSAIASWVAAHFIAKTVAGQTLYDLTQPKG
jgi:4-amino-4-deoxy-L-arabinose transferase-like glycosyltransferase